MSAALIRAPWHQDTELSDNDLVEATRAGDRNAYGVLWDRHSPAALRAARAITSSIDPEDLVSEAFAKTLSAIKNGGGPTDAFRPYLFAAVRSSAATWGGRQKDIALEYIDELPIDDTDDSLDTLSDKSLLTTAFKDLPERWRTLLWYLEVEGMKPREIAPLMGLSPNAVSVLAARAREGFKTAWLQAHIAAPERDPECRWTCERIVAQGRRRRIARADRERFEAHLESCRQCTIASVEITEASSKLRAVLLPLILGGPAAALYSAGSPAPASASIGSSSGAANAAAPWLVAAGVVVVVGAGAVAFAAQLAPAQDPDSAGFAPTSAQSDPPPPLGSPSDDDATTPGTTPSPVPQIPTPVAEPTLEVDDAVESSVTGPSDAAGPFDAMPIATQVPRATAPSGPAAPALPTVPPGERPAPPRAAPAPLPTVEPTPLPTVEPNPPRVAPTPPPTVAPTPTPPPPPPTVEPTPPPTEEPTDLPPTISWTIPQPATVPPDVTGTGTPGGEISILDESDRVLGTTLVAEDGTFAVALDPSSLHQGMTITARHRSPISARETRSAQLGPIVFDLPSVLGAGGAREVDRTDLDADGRDDDVEITVHGIAGAAVLMSVDGEQRPAVRLESGSRAETLLDLRPGLHRITLRYVDPASGDLGPEAVEQILVRQ